MSPSQRAAGADNSQDGQPSIQSNSCESTLAKATSAAPVSLATGKGEPPETEQADEERRARLQKLKGKCCRPSSCLFLGQPRRFRQAARLIARRRTMFCGRLLRVCSQFMSLQIDSARCPDKMVLAARKCRAHVFRINYPAAQFAGRRLVSGRQRLPFSGSPNSAAPSSIKAAAPSAPAAAAAEPRKHLADCLRCDEQHTQAISRK